MRGEVSPVARAAPVAGADFGRGGGMRMRIGACGLGVLFWAGFVGSASVGSPRLPQQCLGPGRERGKVPWEGTGYLWCQPSVGLQSPRSTSLALSLRDTKHFCQGLA